MEIHDITYSDGIYNVAYLGTAKDLNGNNIPVIDHTDQLQPDDIQATIDSMTVQIASLNDQLVVAQTQLQAAQSLLERINPMEDARVAQAAQVSQEERAPVIG